MHSKVNLHGLPLCLYEHPRTRLKYLNRPEYGWDVWVYEVGQQGALEGPYQLTGIKPDSPEGTMMALLPRMKYGHFVYVCRRHA
jgi:hypothetical protein